MSCPTIARMIERRFPIVPRADELASALRDDLTGPVYADAYSSAQYRLEVAPVVSERAIRQMASQGHPS